MIALILAYLFPTGLVGLLFKIAIFCVVIWGIWQLLQWAGVTIPRPLMILFICVICIICIYWLYELFQLAT